METIGQRIKKFAIARHSSVAELNRAIGKGRNFLGAYVEGRSKPGAEILDALREAGCNINWLLSGAGEMTQGKGQPTGARADKGLMPDIGPSTAIHARELRGGNEFITAREITITIEAEDGRKIVVTSGRTPGI